MKLNKLSILIGAPLMVSVLTACPDRREPEPESQFVGYWMNESTLADYKKAPSDRAFCAFLSDGYETHLADFDKNESMNIFFIDHDGSTYQVDRTFVVSGRPTPQRLIGHMERDGSFKTDAGAAAPSGYRVRTRSSVFASSWHELSRFIRTDDRLIVESTVQANRYNRYPSQPGVAETADIISYQAVDVRDVKRYSDFMQNCVGSDPAMKARYRSQVLPPQTRGIPDVGVGPGAGGGVGPKVPPVSPPQGRDYNAEFGEEGSPFSREQAQRQGNGYAGQRAAGAPAPRVAPGAGRVPGPQARSYDGPELNPPGDEFGDDSRSTYPRIIQPQSR